MNSSQLCCFLALMCATSLGIAIAFAFQGLWVILPFAGVEMLALAVALHHVHRTACRQEVVSVEAVDVRIETGTHAPEHTCVFKRAWTQVLLQTSVVRGHPSRLLLRSGGKQVEVGACLNDDERMALHRHLADLVQLPTKIPLAANNNSYQ